MLDALAAVETEARRRFAVLQNVARRRCESGEELGPCRHEIAVRSRLFRSAASRSRAVNLSSMVAGRYRAARREDFR